MTEVAIITDTHFGVKNNSTYFLDMMESYYFDYFIPTIKSFGLNHIWHLGDFFENRKVIGVQTFNLIKKILDEIEKEHIGLTVIKGNHDMFFNNTNKVSSIDPLFSRYSNIKIVHECEEIDFFGKKVMFLSWISPESRDRVNGRILETKCDVLCGHLKINNFEVIRGVVCETGMDQSMFDKFDRVLSGHFHVRSTNGRINYLGNPYQTTWGEAHDKKGFHVYDVVNDALRFVQNPSENYVIIRYEDDESFDFDKFRNKIVRVYFDEYDPEKFESFVDKLEKVCYSYVIDDVRETQIEDHESYCISDTTTLIKEWIDSMVVESRVDRKLLDEIVFSIYRESIEGGVLAC